MNGYVRVTWPKTYENYLNRQGLPFSSVGFPHMKSTYVFFSSLQSKQLSKIRFPSLHFIQPFMKTIKGQLLRKSKISKHGLWLLISQGGLNSKGIISEKRKRVTMPRKILLPTITLFSALSIPKPEVSTFRTACCFYTPLP